MGVLFRRVMMTDITPLKKLLIFHKLTLPYYTRLSPALIIHDNKRPQGTLWFRIRSKTDLRRGDGARLTIECNAVVDAHITWSCTGEKSFSSLARGSNKRQSGSTNLSRPIHFRVDFYPIFFCQNFITIRNYRASCQKGTFISFQKRATLWRFKEFGLFCAKVCKKSLPPPPLDLTFLPHDIEKR